MIVALNNKSNLEYSAWDEYCINLLSTKTKAKLILCPTYLNIVRSPRGRIGLGAQNVSKFENGAYTGEISASQLKSYGVKYCIVGHSERREYQKETDEDIAEKIKRLLENDITPILCVGETLEERNNNQVEEVLNRELSYVEKELKKEEKDQIIIAYEPIWSIGTGVIPTNEQIEEVFQFIKKKLPNTAVLYGGSANEENIEELRKISLIDGYLLGGLSLKPDKLQVFLDKCMEDK